LNLTQQLLNKKSLHQTRTTTSHHLTAEFDGEPSSEGIKDVNAERFQKIHEG